MHRTLLLSCLTSRQANRHVLLLVTDGIAVVCLARAVQKPATYQQRMPETPALTANNAKGSALPSQLLQEAVLAVLGVRSGFGILAARTAEPQAKLRV